VHTIFNLLEGTQPLLPRTKDNYVEFMKTGSCTILQYWYLMADCYIQSVYS